MESKYWTPFFLARRQIVIRKILIQGYEGSFHDQCAQMFFKEEIEVVPCDSFDMLARKLLQSNEADLAIMAIENSIAGSILQNYRILRENNFSIIGEAYLKIEMNLMALNGQDLEDINEIHSHPMALYQCRNFLNKHHHIKSSESEDTALSALKIQKHKLKNIATIASRIAAEKYNLNIISENIQDNQSNYTRFFVIQKEKSIHFTKGNKASTYFRIPNSKGSLKSILELIEQLNINITNLQSYLR